MSFLDFFFPRRCLSCGEGGNYFCQECVKTIKLIEKQICPVCEKPAINGATHPCCQSEYSLDGLISIFPYEGIIKTAISKLKYKFITDLARELVSSIIRTIELDKNGQFNYLNRLIGMGEEIILVPVPLHWRRKNWRGFNQAELLGRVLAQNFGWQFEENLLVRSRYTKPQIKLKSEQRKENIRGAFKINSNSKIINHKSNIIIFDDVWTTGSTIKEAGVVLKMAGAEIVWGLTIAR